MADIGLVIKLDEEDYINIKNAINSLIENGLERASMSKVCLAILDGKPLPKGHGRLIDADALKEEMEKDVRRAMSFVDLTDFVWLAPTIIEADSEPQES